MRERKSFFRDLRFFVEKNVEILVDYGIDFNANSIGDNSFLILFDDVSFIENIDDIKRRQEICS